MRASASQNALRIVFPKSTASDSAAPAIPAMNNRRGIRLVVTPDHFISSPFATSQTWQ